ncbi:hypothetical protein BGY98DRAFT_82995 [Russula aff. rugulosa BPL654]|nr:hypothetical protein BGY98DRAFT_82995 [Russula aff. rugulosa BPL654]
MSFFQKAFCHISIFFPFPSSSASSFDPSFVIPAPADPATLSHIRTFCSLLGSFAYPIFTPLDLAPLLRHLSNIIQLR